MPRRGSRVPSAATRPPRRGHGAGGRRLRCPGWRRPARRSGPVHSLAGTGAFTDVSIDLRQLRPGKLGYAGRDMAGRSDVRVPLASKLARVNWRAGPEPRNAADFRCPRGNGFLAGRAIVGARGIRPEHPLCDQPSCGRILLSRRISEAIRRDRTGCAAPKSHGWRRLSRLALEAREWRQTRCIPLGRCARSCARDGRPDDALPLNREQFHRQLGA
jgi:hypothetical protein